MIKAKIRHVNPHKFEIWSKDLTKVYGLRDNKITAVDEINLAVRKGVHGYLGPNGAGKTSTINMLIGAISITKGEAKIRGLKAGSMEAKKLIGFSPQDPAFYGKMTGKEYLEYFGRVSGFGWIKAQEKAKELLRRYDLEGAKGRKIRTYSRGMKQKIGLASALIREPEILILDEPTSNLDPLGRKEIISEIRTLGKEKCVFVSSHVLSEMEQMCDDITIINKGKIILTNTIDNIKKMYAKASNIFLLDTNSNEKVLELLQNNSDFIEKAWIDGRTDKINIIPKDIDVLKRKIPELLFKNNIMLEKFSKEDYSLEEIFLDVVGLNLGGVK